MYKIKMVSCLIGLAFGFSFLVGCGDLFMMEDAEYIPVDMRVPQQTYESTDVPMSETSPETSTEQSPTLVPEPSQRSVFGEMQVFDTPNGRGTWARVDTEKHLLTDEYLVMFFHSHIYNSGHSWVQLHFGDGTIYQIRPTGFFHPAIIDERGSMVHTDDPEFDWNGFIFDDHVFYSFDDA